ncbi:MAG: hypothetical protein KatS3mg115_1941 [Candidatus Poribacteria bacterium]|nr:MAG: hypothetical protein KatS3mg115_1941 [Candidatus Poribacteria bacterium]
MKESQSWTDYYALLGIPPTATREEIRSAYRRRAREYHPDKLQALDASRREEAAEQMRLLNQAYQTLSDPTRRAEYDRLRQEMLSQQTASRKQFQRRFWIALGLILGVGLLAAGGILGRAVWQERQAQRYQKQFQRMQALIESDRIASAYRLAIDLSHQRPEDPQLWDLRWRLAYRLGRTRDAAEALAVLLRFQPTNPSLRIAHAQLRFAIGDVERTREELLWLIQNGALEQAATMLAEFRRLNPLLAERLEGVFQAPPAEETSQRQAGSEAASTAPEPR